MNRPALPILVGILSLFVASTVFAATPVFPYGRRTKPYTGWNSAVRGDDTVIGMAGATVALPFNIGAAEANPAGFAMLMGTVNAQITGTEYSDHQIQQSAGKIKSNYYGLAVNPPPWGFAVTSYSPAFESGPYHSPVTNRDVDAEVSVRELRFTAARMFLDTKLAIGVSLDLAKANRYLGDQNENSVSTGYKFGALYKLPAHLTLGASYGTPNRIRGNPNASTQIDLPGFSQDIVMPAIAAVGIGWTPNRFFQAGASILYVAGTPDTALLADESIGVGRYATLQPRVGGTYTFFQFEHYKGDVALGSYFEATRVEGAKSRLHETASVDVNIHMFNTGIGIDNAAGYRNFMIGIGIDLVRTFKALDIVPKEKLPPYNGFFPPPTRVSADGLSEGLSHGEAKSVPNQSLGDVQKIITEAPGKISDKLQGKAIEPAPSPSPRAKRRRRNNRPANPDEAMPN